MKFIVKKSLSLPIDIRDEKDFPCIDFDNPFVGKVIIKSKRIGNVVCLEVQVDGNEYF